LQDRWKYGQRIPRSFASGAGKIEAKIHFALRVLPADERGGKYLHVVAFGRSFGLADPFYF